MKPALTILRALQVFDHVPAGCALHPVGDDSCDPHLRIGELALIDKTDREPQSGELYLIGYKTALGFPRPVVRQIRFKKSFGNGWWIGPLLRTSLPRRGYATIDAAMASPVRFALSDGPMQLAGLRSLIAGRVVGIFERKHQVLPE